MTPDEVLHHLNIIKAAISTQVQCPICGFRAGHDSGCEIGQARESVHLLIKEIQGVRDNDKKVREGPIK